MTRNELLLAIDVGEDFARTGANIKLLLDTLLRHMREDQDFSHLINPLIRSSAYVKETVRRINETVAEFEKELNL